MYTKHVNLDLLFNEFNLHKIKLLASIEQYYKKSSESTTKYKSLDVRHKFLLLDCHDKLYCLREDLIYNQIIDVKGNRNDDRRLNLECVNVDDTLIDEMLNKYGDSLSPTERFSTFFFVPDENRNIELSMSYHKSYGDFFEKIDLGSVKIDTRFSNVANMQGCLAMPFKMVNKNKKDILEILDRYKTRYIEEER